MDYRIDDRKSVSQMDTGIFHTNLSYKAIGIYFYLAHLKSLKNFKEPMLIERYKKIHGKRPRGTGRTSVRSGLNELINSGWLRKSGHDKHGHIHWDLDYISNYKPYAYQFWKPEERQRYNKMIEIISYPYCHVVDSLSHRVISDLTYFVDNHYRSVTLYHAIMAMAYHSICSKKFPKYRYRYVYWIMMDRHVWHDYCRWHRELVKLIKKGQRDKSLLHWPDGIDVKDEERWGIKI